ncbi:MAG: hypothetical protein IKC03_09045 [Oscillospiraceae bacterium]|nr:hypothetical protein [Oscillospiraceae bacterium]
MKYEYQYEPIATLKGDASKNIRIPKSIITNTKMLGIRLAVFTYLSIYKGLNDKLCFSIPLFLNWAGYKSDAHAGGINDKTIQTLKDLRDLGYVSFSDENLRHRNSCVEIKFNTHLVHNQCFEESFAILYLDEIEKVMKYKNDNPQDRYLNRNIILLVFAYLRQAIFRTPNKLKPEERSPEGIEGRKERCIEAYNESYKDIALDLGLTERIVSLSTQVLVKVGLIVIVEAYRIQNEDGEFRTLDMIFANAEKREGKHLLAIGEDYALGEIKRKLEKIRKSTNTKYFIKVVRS